MSESEKQLTTWEEVIKDFFRIKSESEEEKYIKDTIKSLEDSYKKEDYFSDEKIELVFNTKKNKKAGNESPLDFQHRRAIGLLRAQAKFW